MTKQTADHRHLLGAPIRDRILDEVRTYLDAAGQMGKIVSIAIDGTAEVEVYIRNQARIAAKVGLDFDQQIWQTPHTTLAPSRRGRECVRQSSRRPGPTRCTASQT